MDDELYVRLAGDGLIIATPLGSSAYSMAAGGPLIATGTPAIVCTPVAMHGGSAPPLIVPAGTEARVEVHESFAGFEVQLDGHDSPMQDLEYRVSLEQDKVTLVGFGDDEPMLTGLRERGLIADSPRVLARESAPSRSSSGAALALRAGVLAPPTLDHLALLLAGTFAEGDHLRAVRSGLEVPEVSPGTRTASSSSGRARHRRS